MDGVDHYWLPEVQSHIASHISNLQGLGIDYLELLTGLLIILLLILFIIKPVLMLPEGFNGLHRWYKQSWVI